MKERRHTDDGGEGTICKASCSSRRSGESDNKRIVWSAEPTTKKSLPCLPFGTAPQSRHKISVPTSWVPGKKKKKKKLKKMRLCLNKCQYVLKQY